jgi:hypothetical protein
MRQSEPLHHQGLHGFGFVLELRALHAVLRLPMQQQMRQLMDQREQLLLRTQSGPQGDEVAARKALDLLRQYRSNEPCARALAIGLEAFDVVEDRHRHDLGFEGWTPDYALRDQGPSNLAQNSLATQNHAVLSVQQKYIFYL